MNIKKALEYWPQRTGTPIKNQSLTLSEGYRAYWELKKAMWKNTVFNPLKK